MGLRCLHTSIFIETPSLKGLPNKAKEDPSPHKMRLSLAGHQPSYYYYYYYYHYYYIIIIIQIQIKRYWFECIFDFIEKKKVSEPSPMTKRFWPKFLMKFPFRCSLNCSCNGNICFILNTFNFLQLIIRFAIYSQGMI